jgi:23S rRNA pseudouridine2605 synthase
LKKEYQRSYRKKTGEPRKGDDSRQAIPAGKKRIPTTRPGRYRPRPTRPAGTSEKSTNDGIRLNKYIANAGVCSRREADELIANGLVTVNNKLVTELGTKVMPGDTVRFDGEVLKNEQKVYIIMNKPKDYITTVEDPHAQRTVMDLIGNKCPVRVYPVGRLDRNTTGVLLLTNDGELAKKLTHPRYNKKKIYHVFLDKSLKDKDLQEITKGVSIEDIFIRPDAIHFADVNDKTQVGIEIHSGQNRIVRKIFESFGYRIRKLDRVYFAGLTKKGLQRGEWRFLKDKEINMLKMMAFE